MPLMVRNELLCHSIVVISHSVDSARHIRYVEAAEIVTECPTHEHMYSTLEFYHERQPKAFCFGAFREIIADLRLRLKYLKMWIWGFRRWHYNVQLLQLEAHEEVCTNDLCCLLYNMTWLYGRQWQ